MSQAVRLGLVGAVIAALLGLQWWQQGRRQRAEDRQAAIADGTAAMKALNQADATFPDEVRGELAAVAVDAALQPARAGERLEARVVPMFDAYLATLDRAVVGAERVLAVVPDAEVRRNVERIQARGRTMRTMRDALVELRGSIAAGADGDRIARELNAIGLSALRTTFPGPTPGP